MILDIERDLFEEIANSNGAHLHGVIAQASNLPHECIPVLSEKLRGDDLYGFISNPTVRAGINLECLMRVIRREVRVVNLFIAWSINDFSCYKKGIVISLLSVGDTELLEKTAAQLGIYGENEINAAIGGKLDLSKPRYTGGRGLFRCQAD